MIVVICHAPDRILTVLKAVHKSNGIQCPHPLVYASHICNLLIVLNSSTNFFVYCIFRSRFRHILLTQVCRCGGRMDQRRASIMSTASVLGGVAGGNALGGFNSYRHRPSYTVYDSQASENANGLASSDTVCDSHRLRRHRMMEQQHSSCSVDRPLLMLLPPTTPTSVTVNGGCLKSAAVVDSSVDDLSTMQSAPCTPLSIAESDACWISEPSPSVSKKRTCQNGGSAAVGNRSSSALSSRSPSVGNVASVAAEKPHQFPPESPISETTDVVRVNGGAVYSDSSDGR
jgi:hypothetical protein